MKQVFAILIVLLLTYTIVNAQQSTTDKFALALKLKKELKYEAAFLLFKELLSTDSANADYLAHTAFLFAKTGYSQTTEAQRTFYYKKAEYLAQKAININQHHAQAYYAYAFALGRLNENASSKQKISNAKIIKSACEKALQLDPKLGGCHHILGRWHRTIVGFNFIEKLAINTLFGGVPQGGSYESAIDEFQKAIMLEPHYILHYYELAQTYFERNKKGDKVFAKVWAENALKLKPNSFDADENNTRLKCTELLKKLN